MMRGIFVTGTDTDVGKTYITRLLAAQLSASGVHVIPRKPVESGCLNLHGELIPADASALRAAANYAGDLSEVCRYRFEAALSPVRAARLSQQAVTIAQLCAACSHQAEDGFVLVEGAGGFYSPLAEDGLNADLAAALQLPVLLIASDKLGCINHTLLTAETIAQRGLRLAAIVLNAKDQPGQPEMNNAEDLREHIDTPIYTFAHEQHSRQVLLELSDYLLRL